MLMRSEKEPLATNIPKSVELKVEHQGVDATGQEPSQSATFSLTPSPDELLQQLTSLENLNEDVVEAKFTGLRVLWPGYFFTLQATEGSSKATLVLDAAENGFGVVIESEVDTSLYPKLRQLESGKKLWIGGAITAVDRTGTGTVHLKAENFNFNDEPAFPPAIGQKAK
ncbi:MAG: hypothetical protein OEL83_16325 [Desulforhopalus sp.]|nr:hypothetical protein [Desulforhopalus sp.]